MEQDDKNTLTVDGIDFRRLYTAVETSYKKMEWFRKLTAELVQEFAGPAYGKKGGRDKPLNKLNQLIEAYVMLTASSDPNVDIEPEDAKEGLRGFARLWAAAINKLGKKVRLSDKILAWVEDAFFGMGIIRLHRDKYRKELFGEDRIDPGIPSCSNVPVEDWVCDMRATHWPNVSFTGDKYRVPFRTIQEGVDKGIYDAAVAKELAATSKSSADAGKLEQIGRGEITDDDELEPMIDLCEIWVEQTNRIYICALEDASRFLCKKIKPLGHLDWVVPDHPPHVALMFTRVPHHILPVSPASHLWPLDKAINNVVNKEIDRAVNQKQNPIYSPQGEETMRAAVKASDLVPIKGDPSTVKVVEWGGVPQNMHQALLAFNEFFNQQSGNLEALAGLGASAGTLGQEQIIANASNRKVASLQGKVAKAVGELFRCLGIMLWHDKLLKLSTTVNAGWEVPEEWTPEYRVGDFVDYTFQINPFNRGLMPPAAQAEQLIGLVERIFAPLMQMIMAQGGQIDVAKLAQRLGELLDDPSIEDIVKFTTPPSSDEQDAEQSMPASTTRTYNRQSLPQQQDSGSRLAATLTGMQAADNNVGLGGEAA